MPVSQTLQKLREASGEKITTGLTDTVIDAYAKEFPDLVLAVERAAEHLKQLTAEQKKMLQMKEDDLARHLQSDFLNFYAPDAVNPYVAFAAAGPWVVTSHGSVVHDSGGYGMLGFGHTPEKVLQAMGRNEVMANIMTASFSQKTFSEKMQREVGHRRPAHLRHPYAKFLCLNSGSEAMTVATRFSDLHAKKVTDPGGRHAGKQIKFLVMRGSFHGRTERPAQASHSSQAAYHALASFRGERLVAIEPNNTAELKEAFAKAEQDNVYFETMLLEPVMGEGNPGLAVTPEFYALARELTKKHGTLLLVDSIQAGLRTQGYLSITDYPGFEQLPPPDMESYSKALNAGQYPLSVLAVGSDVAALYKTGIYGNTMTTNPRALEVACAVLDMLTPAIRENIRARGQELLEKFKQLQNEFPAAVTKAQGTGLLCSLALKEEGFQVLGMGGMERFLRTKGIGVIHGGKNALRFTPHFAISSREIDLIISGLREALKAGPVYR